MSSTSRSTARPLRSPRAATGSTASEMQAELDAFVAALEHDLIDPSDFAR